MIGRSAIALGFGALALAGCEVTPDGQLVPARGFLAEFESPGSRGGLGALSQPDASARLIDAAALAEGAVVVAGPRGYCVDPQTIETDGQGGFAVLASCNILSDGAAGPEVPPALITVTVGPAERQAVRPDAETLARLAGAPLVAQRERGGLVLAYLGSGGEALFESGAPQYWRGAFLQGQRLVGLAVYAPEGSRATGAAGARLLEETWRQIRAASPDPATPVSAAPRDPSRG